MTKAFLDTLLGGCTEIFTLSLPRFLYQHTQLLKEDNRKHHFYFQSLYTLIQQIEALCISTITFSSDVCSDLVLEH